MIERLSIVAASHGLEMCPDLAKRGPVFRSLQNRHGYCFGHRWGRDLIMLQATDVEIERVLREFADAEVLNNVFVRNARGYFFDFAAMLLENARSLYRPLIVGLNGSQGSGKSTLAAFLRRVINECSDYDCHVISIDDFYLTKDARQALASNVHPLLATRGVPGTHDVGAMRSIIDRFKSNEFGSIELPVFDKLLDDRAKTVQTINFGAKRSIVLVEGWCVGVPAQATEVLSQPISHFESVNDTEAIWRHYVNESLATDYADLFSELDCLSMLNPPSFETVYDWRVDQEMRLVQARSSMGTDPDAKGMNPRQIREFVENFRRVSLHAIDALPGIADFGWHLRADRLITDQWSSI
jgi:D-glycerate 3-kinase